MTKNTLLSIILFLLLSEFAYGYLDSGTGNYLIQILIASLLGVVLSIKIFWIRIKEILESILVEIQIVHMKQRRTK